MMALSLILRGWYGANCMYFLTAGLHVGIGGVDHGVGLAGGVGEVS